MSGNDRNQRQMVFVMVYNMHISLDSGAWGMLVVVSLVV